MWDITSGKELLKLADHPGWVWTAAYSSDGNLIATVSGDQAVIWDAATGEKLHILMGQMNYIQVVDFSPDSSKLATGGVDRTVKIWDVETGNVLVSLVGHTGSISSVAFSHDGAHLISASEDGTIKTWDLKLSREWVTINSSESVNQIAFSSDGTLLMGGESDRMAIWDVGTGKELQELSGYRENISAIAVSADDKHLIATSDGSDVKIWDGLPENEPITWSAHTGWVNSLTFSPDGKHLATASDDYKIKIWDISADPNTGRITANLSVTFDLPAEVKSLSFNSDGSKLAAGTGNGIVNIWDMNTGRVLLNFWGHADAITCIAFSPNDKYLATASLDGTAIVSNMTTEKESLALHGHIGALTAVVFSPDGRNIATASRDGTAKLWNSETGQEMLTLYGDGSGLNSIVFSPDGSLLATGGDTGVHIYIMKTEDLVAMARSRVTRGLTSDECQKYLHHISAACTQPNVIPTTTPLPAATHGRICQVTNTSGLYDNYFNEAIFKGVQNVSTIYDWETNILQSISVSDYEKNIRAFMGSNCNLIVVTGNIIEMVGIAAEANPSQKFMITDWVPDQPLENVWTQTYATDQAAFLAGFVAASVTKTGKVGIFGGVDTPQVTDYMDGFTLGVDYYNSKNGTSVQVLGWDVERHEGLFAGSFCCSTEGRQMTKQLLDDGADIVMPVAGQSIGWGAGAEIIEHGDALLIGVDTDWTVAFPEFTSILLTSIEKNYEVSVTLVAKSIVDNNFAGGVHIGSLSDAEVGISAFHALDGLISLKVKADLEQIKADIIAGKIVTKP